MKTINTMAINTIENKNFASNYSEFPVELDSKRRVLRFRLLSATAFEFCLTFSCCPFSFAIFLT